MLNIVSNSCLEISKYAYQEDRKGCSELGALRYVLELEFFLLTWNFTPKSQPNLNLSANGSENVLCLMKAWNCNDFRGVQKLKPQWRGL
jgi:hypothetical protein